MALSWLRRLPWPALLLALAVVGLHLGARAAAPAPRFWGDEGHYALLAQEDAQQGRTSLLPGTLGFDHRPIFAARVYARLVPRLFARLTLLNTGLLAAVVLLTYGKARLLGLGRSGALLAAALLGLFPWLGFHVHSLWPEILHAFFSGLAWLGLLAYLRSQRLVLLLPAGAASAYALFTKGSVGPFLPLFLVFLAAATWRASPLANRPRLVRALAAPGLFALGLLALVVPQLVRNVAAGHGPHLAANRWWNLELGLASDASVGEVNERYWAGSDDPLERERLARERTLAGARALGLPGLLAGQTAKLGALLFRKPSELEASLHREARWGDPPPAWLAALERPARLHWYALLLLGGLGMILAGTRSSGWFLLLLFALAFLAALWLVPVKPRFALPLVPVLCLFAGAALERLGGRIGSLLPHGRAPATRAAGET